MKKNFTYWFRWIAVLPGALIVGFLATFPLHWVLYFTLARGETISGVNIGPIEYNLSPFVIAITFILVGFGIAPDHKFKASVALSIIWILSFIGFLIFMSDIAQFQLRGVLSLIGSLIGLCLAWWKYKSEEKAGVR